jgi:hypothetical protein
MTVITGQLETDGIGFSDFLQAQADTDKGIEPTGLTTTRASTARFYIEETEERAPLPMRSTEERIPEVGVLPLGPYEAGVSMRSIAVEPLRYCGAIATLGFVIGMVLLTIGSTIGLPIMFASGGIFGFGVLVFSIENEIEIIKTRHLVAIILGLFGIALSGLLAILLRG